MVAGIPSSLPAFWMVAGISRAFLILLAISWRVLDGSCYFLRCNYSMLKKSLSSLEGPQQPQELFPIYLNDDG